MKKLCVIGNSQMAALKEGYDRLKTKSYNASFWGIPGGHGPTISIVNGKIVAPINKKSEVITDIQPNQELDLDISGYDAILLSGVGIPAIRKDAPMFIRNYLAADLIENDLLSNKQVISKRVFAELVHPQLRKLDSFLNIDKIRSIFDGDIYIQPFPLPTENFIKQRDFDLHCYGRNAGLFFSWLHSQQISILNEHISGRNISLITYPRKWVASGFTPSKYASDYDAWHMNAEFGELIMRELSLKLFH